MPQQKEKRLGFATRAIHVGQEPDPTTGAVIPPIYATSTYAQTSPGVHKGFEYSRTHNPTRFNLEAAIASLESGKQGYAFASGLAATATILDSLPAGSHIVASDDIYGGSYRLFERVRKHSANLSITYLDLTNAEALEGAIQPNTKLLWVETPSNPLLKVLDLTALAEIATKRGVLSVCDNTFATPYIQQPLACGFDVVMHSATKYLNGHSDVISGLVVVRKDSEFSEKLRFLQNACGAIPSPFDCYLVQRGIKTLAVRMERHCKSSLELAHFLEAHSAVQKVYYPGLPSHSQHSVAAKQMCGFGGMISMVVKGGLDKARSTLERVRIFTLAESLGGVESLIEHPAIMTHASIPQETRLKIGIEDGLIRLSVGIEDVEDLKEDLATALG